MTKELTKITQESADVYSTDYGWGLFKDNGGKTSSRYSRTYTWNERNQLVSSVDSAFATNYIYGQDGQRSNKYTQNSETLYFNKMWTLHTDSGNATSGGQTAKNIYLGDTRIVTKLNSGTGATYSEEHAKQYFYHSDHLGSASLISDYKGDEYQRIEYTPYGETWVEKTQNTGLEWLPYKFTAKEMDEETGLYYYGARYLDPKYSRWLSTDPALGEYVPAAGKGTEKDAGNHPGMGGLFNTVNGNLYHYAGNNPVKYTDPDGKSDWFIQFLFNWFENNSAPPTQKDIFNASIQQAEQQFDNCNKDIQYKLSNVMEKAMTVANDTIISCAEFTSNYGGVIAVVCYASGNIGLGMVIDGITIACDISLTYNSYRNGDLSKSEAIKEVCKTGIEFCIGLGVSNSFIKTAERSLMDSKTMEMISNALSDCTSQVISVVNDIFIE